MRLDTLKKTGFPPEECPVCRAAYVGCEHCDGGVFELRIKPGWEPPIPNAGERLVAVSDGDSWYFIGIENMNGDDIVECVWPFENNFATGSHFRALGFQTEYT